MTTVELSVANAAPPRAWRIVAERELRDLWGGGRGLGLALIAALLFSVVSYLSASQTALNLLDAKEAVHLLVQVVVVLGGLLTLVVAADAVSGERDRRTLEPVLLAPIHRHDIAIGKLIAALSLWLATLAVAVPYIAVLGTGPGVARTALVATAVVGTLIAIGLAGLGFIVSGLSNSNRLSLAIALFAVLALTVPSRVPQITNNSIGNALLHGNPITSGLAAIERLIVKGESWGGLTGWLISPVIGAAAVIALSVSLAARLLVLERNPQ